MTDLHEMHEVWGPSKQRHQPRCKLSVPRTAQNMEQVGIADFGL